MNLLELFIGSLFFYAFNILWVIYIVPDQEELVVAIVLLSFIFILLAACSCLFLKLDARFLLEFVPFADTSFDYITEELGIEVD